MAASKSSDGHHGTGLLPQAKDGTLDRDWVDRQVWRPIEMQPGDLLFFDSYVPHRSGPNRSDRPRRALYVTYNRASDGDYREANTSRRSARPSRPSANAWPGGDYSTAAVDLQPRQSDHVGLRPAGDRTVVIDFAARVRFPARP